MIIMGAAWIPKDRPMKPACWILASLWILPLTPFTADKWWRERWKGTSSKFLS